MNFILKSEKEKSTPEITLWLKDKRGGFINLIGKDKNGVEKDILSFRNGKFYRFTNAQLEGLETDERGKIIKGGDQNHD